MQDGWFVILLVLALLTFAGVVLWSWLARTMAEHRDKEALTATDLRLLEESVEALIARLKAASDEAVAEMDRRQRALEELLDRVDTAIAERAPAPDPDSPMRAGLSRAEVELMLGVQAARGTAPGPDD